MANPPATAPSPAPAPAAAPRATVLMRAGPPPRTGRLDLAVGAIGAVLLLSTVGLAVALPDREVLPQQFKVTYVDEPHDLTRQEFLFRIGTDASTHDFLYEIPDDNAYLLTVQYEFVDDVGTSRPDQFLLRLYDPQGNPVGPDVLAENAPAVPRPDSSMGPGEANVTTEYEAVRMVGQFSVVLPKPPDDIVEVPDQEVGPEALAQQLEAQAHLDTRGTWKLRVTMLQAGNCPLPSDGKEAANRRAVCQRELVEAGAPPGQVAQGTDLGNRFTVGVFSYSRFAADVQKIG